MGDWWWQVGARIKCGLRHPPGKSMRTLTLTESEKRHFSPPYTTRRRKLFSYRLFKYHSKQFAMTYIKQLLTFRSLWNICLQSTCLIPVINARHYISPGNAVQRQCSARVEDLSPSEGHFDIYNYNIILEPIKIIYLNIFCYNLLRCSFLAVC